LIAVTARDDDLTARARSRVGQTLRSKWTLEGLLGVGGMAAVYAARHRNASRGAVKLLHPALAHDPGVCSRFLREGYVANTVEHAGVVRVLDDDTCEDGTVFLVMELLEGETVEQRATRKGGRLSAEEVLSIADQLLDVLVAAHAKGILHRDVKPENIFLTTEGRLKVLDFGIAKVRDATRSSATQTGTTMGTPAFMAPEQALGRTREVDHRTDLWAAGATMFTLLTGRYVHEGESGNEVLVRAATQRAPSVAQVAPDVPGVVADVVDRALAFERDARFTDAASFQLEVRRAYHALYGRDAVIQAPRGSLVDLEEARTVVGPGLMARPVESAAVVGALTAQAPSSTGVGVARTATTSGAGAPAAKWAIIGGVGALVVVLGGGAVLFVGRSGDPQVTPASATVSPSAPTPPPPPAAPSSPVVTPYVAPASSSGAASVEALPNVGTPRIGDARKGKDVSSKADPPTKAPADPRSNPPPADPPAKPAKPPAGNPLDRQD
jgi:serine/threonine-protein kinase